MEIIGKYCTAQCYAKVIEEGAAAQIKEMCDTELTNGSRVAIMPDVHAGAGCTIGTTMTVKDKACPNVVGVDIGCGMYTLKLEAKALDFESIDAACRFIPSGQNVWKQCLEPFDFKALKCYRHLKYKNWLERSLGTLGGGNHFIEIDSSRDGDFYLVIHSGSRNLGKQVAEYYQRVAVDLHKGKGALYEQKEALIKAYKEQDRRNEISKALVLLEKSFLETKPDVSENLCWLYGQFFDEYLEDIELCQQFATRNRELIAQTFLEKTGLQAGEAFHTIHNYIDTNEMILRKGAIAAHKGEKVLIPINMRDGSVLAIGKGNPDWNYSAPHGAGRILSRAKAKRTLDLEAYKKSMEGVYTTSVCAETIDESPMAYKSIDDIIDVISESVDVIDIMKSVYNFKAAEEEAFWRKAKK